MTCFSPLSGGSDRVRTSPILSVPQVLPLEDAGSHPPALHLHHPHRPTPSLPPPHPLPGLGLGEPGVLVWGRFHPASRTPRVSVVRCWAVHRWAARAQPQGPPPLSPTPTIITLLICLWQQLPLHCQPQGLGTCSCHLQCSLLLTTEAQKPLGRKRSSQSTPKS